MSTSSYTVRGMTCDHCASSVRAEVAALPGVADVAVDVATGRVQVTAQAPLSEAQVREAVEEAGYELVSAD